MPPAIQIQKSFLRMPQMGRSESGRLVPASMRFFVSIAAGRRGTIGWRGAWVLVYDVSARRPVSWRCRSLVMGDFQGLLAPGRTGTSFLYAR